MLRWEFRYYKFITLLAHNDSIHWCNQFIYCLIIVVSLEQFILPLNKFNFHFYRAYYIFFFHQNQFKIYIISNKTNWMYIARLWITTCKWFVITWLKCPTSWLVVLKRMLRICCSWIHIIDVVFATSLVYSLTIWTEKNVFNFAEVCK